MLKTVTKDDALSAVYTYDAGGRRVRSWDTVDGTVDYVYTGLNIIDEIDSGVQEKHIFAGGMHVASNTTDTIKYYHADHLGSTRVKTSESGLVIYESNYEPFGPSSGESGSIYYQPYSNKVYSSLSSTQKPQRNPNFFIKSWIIFFPVFFYFIIDFIF